ncbi:hypothetical protein PoB_001597200 [Plakobranchus ocellatus]|uniref:Uncharacterized protein n=1 Tax=Plakobranchus ocellatus TaxID=259542 RepID=A0AAV3Z4M3_9GAST|nr:hypothetical protein PoB_001597200 [Plakobranchus ocellatus]
MYDFSDVAGSRDYERPWATSPTRRTKPKKAEEGIKSKPEWNADNKTKHLSSFDELWEGANIPGLAKKERTVTSASGFRKSRQGMSAATNAWDSVGLEDSEKQFTSPPYRGPGGHQKVNRTRMTEEELLAAESLSSSRRTQNPKASSVGPELSATASCSVKDRKKEIKKHRQQLGEILAQKGTENIRANDSGLGLDLSPRADDSDDDAIELLENADDLRREGVMNSRIR